MVLGYDALGEPAVAIMSNKITEHKTDTDPMTSASAVPEGTDTPDAQYGSMAGRLFAGRMEPLRGRDADGRMVPEPRRDPISCLSNFYFSSHPGGEALGGVALINRQFEKAGAGD